MNRKQREAFTQDEVTAIIRRALMEQGNEETFSMEELEDIARQSGVAPWRLREAIVLEREARDREEMKRRMAPFYARFWGGYAFVQTGTLMLIIFLMASGQSGPGALVGWMVGSALGVLLVRYLSLSMEQSILRKLQERRVAREEAMHPQLQAEEVSEHQPAGGAV